MKSRLWIPLLLLALLGLGAVLLRVLPGEERVASAPPPPAPTGALPAQLAEISVLGDLRWSEDGRTLHFRRAPASGEPEEWAWRGGSVAPRPYPTEGEPRAETIGDGLRRLLGDARHGPALRLDDERVILPVERKRRVHLAVAPRDGSLALQWLPGVLEEAAGFEAGRLAVRPDAGAVAFVRTTPRAPDEIVLVELDSGESRRLTRFHLDLARAGLGSVQAAELAERAEKYTILITYPPQGGASPPWPLAFLPGDIGAPPRTARFDPVAQLVAAQGYLTIRVASGPSPEGGYRRVQRAVQELRNQGMGSEAEPLLLGSERTLAALLEVARDAKEGRADALTGYNGGWPQGWILLPGGEDHRHPARSALEALSGALTRP